VLFLFTFFISLYVCLSGLISPGVSVPIAVPGQPGDMASQYWPRLQWQWWAWDSLCPEVSGLLSAADTSPGATSSAASNLAHDANSNEQHHYAEHHHWHPSAAAAALVEPPPPPPAATSANWEKWRTLDCFVLLFARDGLRACLYISL
jgi:hypothetical protein